MEYQNIFQALEAIQQKLKVERTRTVNIRDKAFKYRSAEDIMGAVKPLLHETGTVLTIDNKPVVMDGNPYCLTVAKLTLVKDGTSVSASAFAREATSDVKTTKWTEAATKYASEKICESTASLDQIKGGQGSGAAISYAEKYALGALFLIDDSVDLDSTMSDTPPAQQPAQQQQQPAQQQPNYSVQYYVDLVLTRVTEGNAQAAKDGLAYIEQHFPSYNLETLRKIVK